MASPLRLHVGRAFWLSRGGALVGIVALHVGAIAVALTMRGPSPDVVVDDPIRVVMITETRSEPPPQQQAVVMVEPELVQPVMPLLQIELPPAPAAVTVAPVPPPAPPTPVAAQRSGADGDEPVVVTQVDYVRPPSIAYPPAAKRARAQGMVEVNVLVDTQGKPREARVHRTSGFAALDKAAIEAVLAALFRPYVHDGVPRNMRVIVPVNFSLTTRTASRRGNDRGRSELDVRGEDHHAMRGHPEELGRLGTAALHPGE